MSLVIYGSRYFLASSSSWEDVSVGFTAMAAELGGADGRKVRMDLTGSDWGDHYDDINGASVTRDVGLAYDGTDAVNIVPPSSQLDNGNKTTYSCIMFGLDVSNGGAKNTAQVNLGFCIAYGSRYWDLATHSKVTGIEGSLTQGGAPSSNGRAAVFENYLVPGTDLRRAFCVTATTVQSFHQPISGTFPDSGPDADKLHLLGNSSNHANDPPLIATEWLYFEQETDFRQNRGNASGRNRLDVWARDGYLGYLEIPLNHDAGWNFGYTYARQIEYIGALWNNPGTANANNFLRVSHPIVALNRAKDDRIGPPSGFLT